MTRIEFFFDCSSPWTYLAFHRLPAIARDMGAEIIWRPFLVGGVFNSVNPSVYEFRRAPVPAKAAYMAKDLADWARLTGLTILWPPRVFPVNSVKAMRACLLLDGTGYLPDFARGVFKAYWGENRDIGELAVLADVCRQCDIDPAVLEGVSRPEIKQLLKDNTAELIARGGFGSPTLFVGEDMYFGNDRLELMHAMHAPAQGR